MFDCFDCWFRSGFPLIPLRISADSAADAEKLVSGTHILKAFSIRVSNFCLLHCWWLVDSFSSQNCCTTVFLWTMGWRCLKTAAHHRSVVKDLSRKLLKFSVGHSTDGLLSLADRVMLLELSTGWLTSPCMQAGSLFHFAGSYLIWSEPPDVRENRQMSAKIARCSWIINGLHISHFGHFFVNVFV